jgi:hypothetical protein
VEVNQSNSQLYKDLFHSQERDLEKKERDFIYFIYVTLEDFDVFFAHAAVNIFC